MTNMQRFLEQLQAIPNPSHALRAYIGGVESRVRINAEDITAPDWEARAQNLDTINLQRWFALSEGERTAARTAAI